MDRLIIKKGELIRDLRQYSTFARVCIEGSKILNNREAKLANLVNLVNSNPMWGRLVEDYKNCRRRYSGLEKAWQEFLETSKEIQETIEHFSDDYCLFAPSFTVN